MIETLNPSSTDIESRLLNFLGRQNVMQQAMPAKIVQFKLKWISPFWFQSIKTQIVHHWWSLNLGNYFEDYWCLSNQFTSYHIGLKAYVWNKREDYENAFLSTTAMLVGNRKKICRRSIFEGKSLVSVLFLQYWKKRADQAWFHLKNLDMNPLHTVYIQTQNPLLDSRVQYWVSRKKDTLSSTPVTAAIVDYT